MITNRDIKIIEAILFASNEPVLEDDLKDKIREKNKLKDYLLDLKQFYSNRGVRRSFTISATKIGSYEKNSKTIVCQTFD